ncbi:hypothetical protein BH09PAT1_BH09PAT1_0520 [soil metagenome]
MKYLLAFIFSALTLVGLKSIAHAETSVNVSNNTSGNNTTHVSVNSNVNSNSQTTITGNSTTNIHIENNGEVKDFNTNGDESVDWKSSDGKSSVKINTNRPTVSQTPTSTKESVDDNDDVTLTASPSVTQSPAKSAIKSNSFFAKLFSWLSSIFK